MTGHRPLIVTFLAPAPRCNQHCPACILDRAGEPVRDFSLDPSHYAEMLEQLLAAGLPIVLTSFQGYEVTLPRSWPYLEAVFRVAQRASIRRSFITNGMLLDRFADRIVSLDPARVSISLDGGDEVTNDALRGLTGAFRQTSRAIERLLRAVPTYAARLAVVSTLYSEQNAASLTRLPRLLRRWGIPRWNVGFELHLANGRQVPVAPRDDVGRWVLLLAEAAEANNIRFHVNDEFGFFRDEAGVSILPRARGVPAHTRFVRIEPGGFVRVGGDILARFDPSQCLRWVPGQRDLATLLADIPGEPA